MNWIALDEHDVPGLSGTGIECNITSGNLAHALHAEQSVLLIPSRDGADVLIAQCRRPVVKMQAPQPAGFESSGILGLDGDAVYLDELPEAKPWWKRIF